LRSLKSFPSFQTAFHSFVQEEARSEAENVLKDKDDARSEFNLDNLRKFSYKEQLVKFQRTNPLLMASIIGTISKSKVTKYEDISRKGFGGRHRTQDIDLIPSVVQSVSRQGCIKFTDSLQSRVQNK
jgi:hypothetical protein